MDDVNFETIPVKPVVESHALVSTNQSGSTESFNYCACNLDWIVQNAAVLYVSLFFQSTQQVLLYLFLYSVIDYL